MTNWKAEHIQILKALFEGREDVFAIRWEKEGKSGYMPAYEVDWYAYKRHKIKGGTFHNFPDKKLLPLTDEQIIKHLNGEHFIGIYPLLEDNTSFFIAADFDKENWVEACRKLISCCQDVGLPTYLERSRSGEGGHVWLFFDAPYPAYKSRKIFTHLLEEAGIVSAFDKNASFDRLFPNQDYLSGKGFGNLIALPFHQKALAQGNSCFIHPETLLPYSYPWSFLSEIEKVATAQLDTIFASLLEDKSDHVPEPLLVTNNKLSIRLDNKVFIHRNYMPAELIKFLKDELNFVSSQYQIKRKLKKNTWRTEKYVSSIEETEQEVVIPRGFIGRLLRFCRKKQIEYEFTDQREKLPAVQFHSQFSLKNYQNSALEAADKKDFGIIVAPPGSGKTIMGLAIIAQKRQPALIVVHRKQLYDQWVERIQSFLGIPKHEIGKIAQGQVNVGANITIAMIQSLSKALANRSISSQFGLILIDECHHVPAKSFRETISLLPTYYLYGLTATPFRKHNDEKLLFVHLGEKIVEIKPDLPEVRKEVQIIVRETSLDIPFDSKTDTPEVLFKMLIHDGPRNRLTLQDIEREVTAGKKVVVLTERKEHINSLNQYLKHSYETIMLSGDDAATVRKPKWQQLQAGHFQVLITTGQLFGEGTDLHHIDCLVLAYPFAFEGKLVQYMGRVQRTELTPVIYDYRDRKITYLEKLFKKRNRYYQKLRKLGLLKEHEELILTFDGDKAYLNPEDEYLSLDDLGLPEWITALQAGTCWRIRVIHFHQESGTLLADVLNYAAQEEEAEMFQQQHSFLFYNIERIDFRSLNTSHILPSVARRDLSKVSAEKSPLENHLNQQGTYTIEKTIHLSWEKMHFLPAAVTFQYFVPDLQQEVSFEVTNLDIRPEFEVLKSYFAKTTRSRQVKVHILLHTKGQDIVSKQAVSDTIDKINQEVIESVRFRFINKEIVRQKPLSTDHGKMLNLQQLIQKGNLWHNSEQQLLDELLQFQKVKHFQQLQYLSKQHDSSILKIRFVLDPFSFIFLLTGREQYHVIWETMDTEEATYLWHIDKSMDSLKQKLKEIDGALNLIRNHGRQAYLDKDSSNFSRIQHDYTDARTGFMKWKGMLEERLV